MRTPSFSFVTMKNLLAIAAAAVVGLLLPGTSHAAVNVGGDLDFGDGAPVQRQCSLTFACTQLQDVSDGAMVRVPAHGTPLGVITAWRIRADGGTARVRRLAVDSEGVRSLGPGSDWRSLDSTSSVQEFGARLPVAEGDAVAVDIMVGTKLWADAHPSGSADSNAAYYWSPELEDDETRDPDDLFDPFVGDLHYQATIEPDRDADGLGDETQDDCVACPGTGGDTPPGGAGPQLPEGGSQPPAVDRYAAIRKSGPKLSIAKAAKASRRGVVGIQVDNPYEFELKGRLELRVAGKRYQLKPFALAAGKSRTFKVKLARKPARTLQRKRRLKAVAVATMRGPVGKARATKRAVVLTAPKPGRAPADEPPRTPGSGRDGTYKGQDLELVVENDTVITFTGSLSLYCTRSGNQKVVRFFETSGDPDPKIAPDGSFKWEATRDYGFVKLKYEGRFVDDKTAKGNLVVEDRSPLFGTERFEFDYCFAGKDWTAKRVGE